MNQDPTTEYGSGATTIIYPDGGATPYVDVDAVAVFNTGAITIYVKCGKGPVGTSDIPVAAGTDIYLPFALKNVTVYSPGATGAWVVIAGRQHVATSGPSGQARGTYEPDTRRAR